jgi:leucyl/phenylalanyl-tRNA--protein transferase
VPSPLTTVPTEPPATGFEFRPRELPEGDEVLGVGADLEPGTILAAYRSGVFPMPVRRRGPIAWWSPDPRGVIPLDGLRVSRSLGRACKRFEIRVDTAYDEVVRACADKRRPGGWINADIITAYRRLHDLGWVHSVEAWSGGRLAGGLYGVSVGGLFAGESMFHRERDASKAALVGLVAMLRAQGDGPRLLDVQWVTPHLASLGAVAVSRSSYLRQLRAALDLASPDLPVPPGQGALE